MIVKTYCVVRMNSTSGPWVVERCQRDVRRWSHADICMVTANKKEAVQEAKRKNEEEE